MALFWLVTFLLLVLAMGFIVYPLIYKKPHCDEELLRDELNKALYRDRLAELDIENNEGIVENKEAVISDLKSSLLDDVILDKTSAKKEIQPKTIVLLSLALVVVFSYAMYDFFGSSSKIVQWHQAQNNLPALSNKMLEVGQNSMTEDEIADLMLGLRTRLHYQPDDKTGWLLLGRLALVNRNLTVATGAMTKAYELDPNDGDIRLGYAQALMLSEKEDEQAHARQILVRLLKSGYVDSRIFSLLGFDAYQRKDFKAAALYWQTMLKVLAPNDPKREMLIRSIENALKMSEEQTTASMSSDHLSQSAVNVNVSLAQTIPLPGNAMLIVSIHDESGSAMPIAAARYPISQFPMQVKLDDSNSMLASKKLSSLKRFMVRARVDVNGDVSDKKGEWYGESEIHTFSEPVNILINKQYN